MLAGTMVELLVELLVVSMAEQKVYNWVEMMADLKVVHLG